MLLKVVKNGLCIDEADEKIKKHSSSEDIVILKWKPLGKRYEDFECKYSTILLGSIKERAQIFNEAWEDVISRWDKVREMFYKAGGPIRVRGRSKSGIEITFDGVDLDNATISIICAHVRHKRTVNS